MALNPLFEFYDQSEEQTLTQDLVDEAIEIHGVNLFYIPRRDRNVDKIYGEDPMPEFTEQFEFEAYLKNVNGFDGTPDFLSKFGLEIRDSGVFTLSKRIFPERVSPSGLQKPREGDLIYFPLTKTLFQITFVQDQAQFLQLGTLYTWDITVELFEYSNERLRTGIPQIDVIENKYASTHTISITAVTGEWNPNDFIYQGTDVVGATFWGEVVSYDDVGIITVKHTGGTIQLDVVLKNNITGATGTVGHSTLLEDDASSNDPFDDNQAIQEQGEEFIHWDKNNPYGEK